MKKMILLLYSLCCIQTLIAQVTWLNPDDQWTYYYIHGWGGKYMEQIQPEKDTVINGLTYKKLARFQGYAGSLSYASFRMMRQEGKKIYVRNHKKLNNPGETLLYDFALQVGDTVRFISYTTEEYGYVITGVSTISIGGQDRVKQSVKWLFLPSYIPYKKGTLIEGLGWIEGTRVVSGEDRLSNSYLFLDEPPGIYADGIEQTFCSFQSGATTFEGAGNVLCKTLPTQEPLENPVYVYPTPSTGTLYFSPLVDGSDYQVTLYDLAGKQLAQATLTGDDSINTIFKGTAVLVVQAGEYRMVQRVVFL